MTAFDARIKFRHLQCFLAVARLRSVNKAATELHVSQPAVSKTLRELEEIIDAPLFDRSSRQMQPTPFGELFLRYAGASVTALAQGIDSIAQARNQGAMMFAVGALPTISSTLLPRAIEAFRREATGAVVKVITGSNLALLAELRVGGLELVIGRLADPEHMTGLAFEHLSTEQVVFVVRQGHPLLDKMPFMLSSIHEHTVLVPPEDAVIRPAVDRLLIANGVSLPQNRIETVSAVFGQTYVREFDAVWIISRGVVSNELESGRLCALPIDTDTTLGPVGLTSRADSQPPPAVQLLMNALRAEARAKSDT